MSMVAMMFGKGEDNNYNNIFFFHINNVENVTKIILITDKLQVMNGSF